MAIIKTITTVNVEAEPRSYHVVNDEEYPFAVHLSFEVEANSEDEASIRFKKFLDNLPQTPELAVYKIEISTSRIVGKTDLVRTFTDTKTLTDNFYNNWLTKRHAIFNRILEEEGSLELIDDTETRLAPKVPAGYLLRATANWAAPVSHKLGITFVAIVNGSQEDNDANFSDVTQNSTCLWALGPKVDSLDNLTAVLTDPLDTQKPRDRGVTFNIKDSVDEFRTHSLLSFEMPPLVEESGFLKADASVDDDFRTLKQLEERSPSQFWTITHLLELEQALTKRVDVMRNPPKTDPPTPPTDPKPLTTWFTDACILSLLDSILITLHMPGMPGVEGQILSEWLNCVKKAAEESKPPLPLPSRAKLLKSTRDALTVDVRNQLELAMKALGISDNPVFKKISKNENFSVPDLINALRDAASNLQEESGVERAIIALFEGRRNKLRDQIQHVDSKGKALVDIALDAFKTKLQSSFNGAEAVARSCGLVFTHALTIGGITTELPDRIIHSNFFCVRFRLGDPVDPVDSDALAAVRGSLWTIDANDEAKYLAKTSLKTALEGIAASFAPQSKSNNRFVPDSTPMPLPIRIAPNMDSDALDTFNRAFNGIGVLIDGGKGWTHACLTHLTATSNGVPIEEHALQSFIPIASDGRSPLFIEYQGLPLATQAFADTGIKNLVNAKAEFFTRQDATGNGPPALVYGNIYKAASFVVSMSGSLPKLLQRDPNQPWYPKLGQFNRLTPPQYETRYLRRTAIGSTTIQHKDKSPVDDRRIGTTYPDVFPLAGDYPRHVLSKYEHLDVLRNGDGSGGLDLKPLNNSNNTIRLKIDDIRFAGVDAKIKLTIHHNERTEISDAGISLDNISLNTISQLHLEFKKGNDTDASKGELVDNTAIFTINTGAQGDCKPSWLRIKLESGDCASFALIQGDSSEEYHSAPSTPPVLLLAMNHENPAENEENPVKKNWKEPFASSANFEVVLPRVGFLDFERWTKNTTIDSSHLPWPRSLLDHPFPGIEDVLIYAYLMRAMNADLASLLDRLPDPAVTQVLVELLPSDSVNGSNRATASKIIELKLPAPPEGLPPTIEQWMPEHFVKLFGQWDEAYRLKVQATCAATALTGPDTNITAGMFTVSLPEGNVSRFSVRPLVPATFFNNKDETAELGNQEVETFAPLHPDLKQLAIGVKDEFVLFSGAEILVESLWDGLPTFSTKDNPLPIGFDPQITPMNVDRSYLIETIVSDNRSHRIVSDMQVHTRAWRFSGRPIYNWIEPKTLNSSMSKSPAIEIDTQEEDEINAVEQFELELDFGRDNADFDSASLQRLLPAPNITVLRKVDWNIPTANYFRHRYTIYSRYRGAMNSGIKSKHLFEENKWQHRVAMLAQATRTEINRPQLRAIIPLTNPPEAESTATPPLACVLQERPFAFGGLAERVLAGIQVGLGYGFQSTNPTVQPLDTRKELGKDPRFTVRAMPKEQVSAAYLLSEGPIGLHFDRSEASAPAWANSQLIVYPRLLDKGQNTLPPETFVAIRMLRMLDSAWVHEPEVTVTNEHYDLSRAWQARFENAGSMKYGNDEVCQISNGNGLWTVYVSGRHLDPFYTPVDGNSHLRVCSATTNHIQAISLIHRYVGEDNYALLVLGHPVGEKNSEDRIKIGENNVPRVLAEINWQRPEQDPKSDTLEFNDMNTVCAFYGSASTERQWARTAQNSNIVYVNGEPVPTNALKINADGKVLNINREEAIPYPTPAEKNVPQTVHRHLLLVYTKRAEGLGRPTDVFHTAKLFVGGEWPTVAGASALRIGEIQVPARPIVAGLRNAPEQYQKVKFDRVAIGATATTDFLFVFRPVVAPSVDLQTIKAKFGNLANLQQLEFKNGSQIPWVLKVNVESGNSPIELNLEGANSETWFDVSMYPLKLGRKDTDIDFDFDWLFTNAGGETDYRSAVSKSGLNTTYEAVAQLVSWSSPITK